MNGSHTYIRINPEALLLNNTNDYPHLFSRPNGLVSHALFAGEPGGVLNALQPGVEVRGRPRKQHIRLEQEIDTPFDFVDYNVY